MTTHTPAPCSCPEALSLREEVAAANLNAKECHEFCRTSDAKVVAVTAERDAALAELSRVREALERFAVDEETLADIRAGGYHELAMAMEVATAALRSQSITPREPGTHGSGT